MSLIGKPTFKTETEELCYLLFTSNWHEDLSEDRHYNSKSGYGVPICSNCQSHWWSHWVYLRRGSDRPECEYCGTQLLKVCRVGVCLWNCPVCDPI